MLVVKRFPITLLVDTLVLLIKTYTHLLEVKLKQYSTPKYTQKAKEIHSNALKNREVILPPNRYKVSSTIFAVCPTKPGGLLTLLFAG